MNHSSQKKTDNASESATLGEGKEKRKIKVKKDKNCDKQSPPGE